MLENCKTAMEKWSGVHELIDKWLNQRQRLLVAYCKLAEQESFDEGNGKHTAQLRQLCEALMDYSSAGHFEIYNQLRSEAITFNDQQALAIGDKQMARIESTTDAILDFNDKYQETDDLSTLSADLSRLGESLEARFNAEDTLIEFMHKAHKDSIA